MDIQESHKYEDWTVERNIANEILNKLKYLKLPYMLDLLTRGRGDCFLVSVLQQCQRPEIRWRVNPIIQKVAMEMDQMGLRWQVRNFMLSKRNHPRVIEMKREYEAGAALADSISWEQFWKDMLVEGKWVDEAFVQVTAWFLYLDIQIISTSSNERNPFTLISGNLEDQNRSCPGPNLLLGAKTNVHYQSLLPSQVALNHSVTIAKLRKREESPSSSKPNQNAFLEAQDTSLKSVRRKDTKEDQIEPVIDRSKIFMYEGKDGRILLFNSEDGEKWICQMCGEEKIRLSQHMQLSAKCNKGIDTNLFSDQFTNFKNDKQRKARKTAKSREKKLNENSQQLHKLEAERQAKSRMEKKQADPTKLAEDEAARQTKSRLGKKQADPTKLAEDEAARQKKSKMERKQADPTKFAKVEAAWQAKSRLGKKREIPAKLAEDERARKAKSRKIETQNERLKAFLEATLYGCIFICISCHRKCFETNVQEYTEKIGMAIHKARPGLVEEATGGCLVRTLIHKPKRDRKLTSNETGMTYICLTCKSHLIKGKLPPMAVGNRLQLYDSDQMLRDQNLNLTELEAALISRTIIFQKIFQLKVSGWSALSDKVINVPIEEDSVLNTIKQIPRTPDEAGLIGIELRRRKGRETFIKPQLVNPTKIFKMLDKLKSAGNPYYKFYDDYTSFEKRCLENDKTGYEIIFYKDDTVEEQLQSLPLLEEFEDEITLSPNEDKEKEDEIDQAEKDEIEYNTKDPVRKTQFKYNSSICLSDRYPETKVTSDEIISVAPGEDQQPVNPLYDKDWDIKAFPHLHNADGSNGKDQVREKRLTDQQYFSQRLCNRETRFSRNPAYMYSAVAYLEKKQLQNNINLCGTRGKKVNHADGKSSYSLEDPYRVMENIKNTPTYWRTKKYEMIAKLDNLGAFQIFWTLSCADKRWMTNFAAILMEAGIEIYYDVVTKEDHPTTAIKARHKEQEWIPIEEFLKDHLNEDLRLLIAGNVITATRYFQDRVKKFITQILMSPSNPMRVKHFSYRVEFQERGAGHIHGVVWLDLKMLQRTFRVGDTQKLISTEECRKINNDIDELKHEIAMLEENLKTVDRILFPEAASCDEFEMKRKQEELREKTESLPFRLLYKTFTKLKMLQRLTQEEIQCLVAFIDSFTTVSLHEGTVGSDVAATAKEVNQHHHTASCRKYGSPCRFHYPRLPSPKTIITQHLLESEKNKVKLIVEYEDIKNKVKEVLKDEKVVKTIMERYDKKSETKEQYESNRAERIEAVCVTAKVSYEKYLLALKTASSRERNTVVLQRDIDEIYINSYNEEWLRAWDANMDIQPCLDFFSVITYILDYGWKPDDGEMKAITTALKEKDPEGKSSTKEKMTIIANALMTYRQIGEAEAIYRALSHMTLTNSSVGCRKVSIGLTEDRVQTWRLATEDVINSGTVHIQEIDGHDGLWYQQQDFWSKYKRRPMDKLGNVCFAQFAKMYESYSPNKKESEEEIESEVIEPNCLNDDTNQMNEDENDEEKYHYKMSFETGNCRGEPLPTFIKIKDPFPKESVIMKKRSFPCVLRFNKPKKKDDPKMFMLHEVMLYYPLADEVNPEEIESKYGEEYSGQRKVDIVKKQIMPHLEGVEEARHYVDQIRKEINLEEVASQLDSMMEQANEDDIESTPHPDFQHLDPGIESGSSDSTCKYKKIEVPPNSVLYEEVRKLDKFQIEVIRMGVKFAKDVRKAEREGNKYPVGPMLMVSGGAGAGKSTVIRTLSQLVQKEAHKEGNLLPYPAVLKTSFTGTASANIDGNTLNGAFNLGFDSKMHYPLNDKARTEKKKQLKYLIMLIIDEVSMVKSDMMYQLDLRLQEIKEKPNIPFGGIAVFVFGDLMQLKPVMGRFVCEQPAAQQFQITDSLSSRWKMFQSLILELNHRQGRDKPYAEMLNRIRTGKQSTDDINSLNTRVRKRGHKDLKDVSMYIVGTRSECRSLNLKYIAGMKGTNYRVKATHHHPTNKNFKPQINQKDNAIGTTSFKDELNLKKGAKVMIIHNISVPDGLTNGQRGVLEDVFMDKEDKPDKLIVKLQSNSSGQQNRRQHPYLASKYPGCVIIEKISYQYSIRKSGGGIAATATLIQFPLVLAHAITAHKIQGQSILFPDTVAMNINSTFEDGQAYVMLSRVQCLDQVYILDSLDKGKLKISQVGLREIERLEKISINNNPTIWKKDTTDTIKIASLNCMQLFPHLADIMNDDQLWKADYVNLSETSIASFVRLQISPESSSKSEKGISLMLLKQNELDVFHVYRSEMGSDQVLLEILKKERNDGKTTIITGDFNLCYKRSPNHRLSKGLKEIGFEQLVEEPTHIRGGLIDHVYWRDAEKTWKHHIETYSPYYSDHDAILVTLEKVGKNIDL